MRELYNIAAVEGNCTILYATERNLHKCEVRSRMLEMMMDQFKLSRIAKMEWEENENNNETFLFLTDIEGEEMGRIECGLIH